MKIIATAVLACVVSPDDGDEVVERSEDSILRWLEAHMEDCRIGDEILIVRRGDADDALRGPARAPDAGGA